ncbi:MAG: nucleotidyltransferase family protein [Acidimicrobiia bacterium]|nr:nucleotidyltransferase family protein [Acidimicrobiia bacterium]
MDAGPDLPLAAQLALSQRVAPLLWRSLRDAEVVRANADEDWAVALSRDASRCKAHAFLVLPQVAERALAPLKAAGLTPLVFKGGALVGRYPEAGLRPMDDVDLVLPPDQLDAGVTTLERVGWSVVPVRRGTHHEVILTHPALPGLPLEMHRALATWRERSNWLSTGDLWQWRTPGTVCGEPAFVLPVEEEIVALAAHAAKPFHVFSRLLWPVDIAVVIGAAEAGAGSVDWERVARIADRARCRTALAVGLSQAERLGASSPAALRTPPARDARERALDPVLSAEWPVIPRTWSVLTRLRYALVDDWRQRVTLLAGQILRYGPADAPRNAVDLSRRGVRRWWRLRREAANHDNGSVGQALAGTGAVVVEPGNDPSHDGGGHA